MAKLNGADSSPARSPVAVHYLLSSIDEGSGFRGWVKVYMHNYVGMNDTLNYMGYFLKLKSSTPRTMGFGLPD